MPTAPAALSPAPGRPLHAHDEFSLAALLDLFEEAPEPARTVPEEPAAGLARAIAPAAPSIAATAAATVRRADGVGRSVRSWAAACRRRAAEWGMGPGGSRRAW